MATSEPADHPPILIQCTICGHVTEHPGVRIYSDGVFLGWTCKCGVTQELRMEAHPTASPGSRA